MDVTDVATAASRYHVRPATLRRWIREGDLPATKAGRTYLLDDRDVRRALEMPRRRGRPSGIQRTPRAKWFHRIAFPSNALLGLGDAGETWRQDDKLPGWEELLEAAPRFKHGLSAWELTSRLLPDVAEAAAAIDYTIEKIHRAIAVAEAYYVPHLPALLAGPEPEFGRHASHPAFADAYSEFANLLWWIRALDDRLERSFYGVRGLLPALAPGSLKDRAWELTLEFRRALATEAGYLANYSLHHSTIPYAFNSSALVVAGRLELPIPNLVTAPVRSHWDLAYGSGRTLSAYAEMASSVVGTFMEALLAAFEDELPARVRRAPA